MAWIENIYFESTDFTLDVPKWEFPDSGVSCVLGESGSGKTTLLQIVAGLLPSKVKIHLSNATSKATNIGFVFQDYGLFPHMTAEENILFAAQAKKISFSTIQGHFENLIKRLDLERVRHVKERFLSGGEKQRVALARALISKPDLVLLDEPFSALDETRRDDARDLVAELALEYKVPFIVVTHDIKDVRRLSQSILLLHQGHMIGSGNTSEILSKPLSKQVAQALPENQLIKVDVKNGSVFLDGTPLKLETRHLSEQNLLLLAKPWSFHVSLTQSAESTLKGTLLHISDEGSHLLVKVKLRNEQTLRAFAQTSIKNELHSGKEVFLNHDPLTLWLIKE